ncbi:MAG TPA: hypothetical protein PKA10_18380 [Selenomonadales bacterium]|nr:hypothetical protein [Selenomonadales bacterium]
MQITETLEFLTQIHTSWNNTEQRMALRKFPRRYLSYEYIGVESWQSQYLRALLYNKQTEQIEIPLWHAASPLPDTTYPGQTQIKLSTDKLWGYRGCRNIILWFSDKRGGDTYAVQALLGDGTVKLGEQIQSIYPGATTTICPVSYAVLQPEDQYAIYDSAHMSMQINLELLTDFTLTPIPASLDEFHFEPWKTKNPWQEALPATYLGAEVFGIAPAWADDLSGRFARSANKLDNQAGVVKYDLKSLNTSESREIDYLSLSRSEINNLQRFFCRCKGRLKSFWAPTWLADMVLTANAEKGQNYLLVEWPLFWKYYRNLARRKTIVVFLNNQTARILTIAGFTTDDAGNGKLILERPLPEGFRKEAVAMISFLCRYRFDSDTMTTDYETVDVAFTSFSFAEVDQ